MADDGPDPRPADEVVQPGAVWLRHRWIAPLGAVLAAAVAVTAILVAVRDAEADRVSQDKDTPAAATASDADDDLFPPSTPTPSPQAAAPAATTRVVTVPGYEDLSPPDVGADECQAGRYPQAAELTAAATDLLPAAKVGTTDEVESEITCAAGTSLGLGLSKGSLLWFTIGYQKGIFEFHRAQCEPACGPNQVLVVASERQLTGRLKPGTEYGVSVYRPDDVALAVIASPEALEKPAITIDELIEVATAQALAEHATAVGEGWDANAG